MGLILSPVGLLIRLVTMMMRNHQEQLSVDVAITLKLCRRGEPGVFCHVKSAKDRREVDATLIVRGRMRLRTEKGTEVADNLLYISVADLEI